MEAVLMVEEKVPSILSKFPFLQEIRSKSYAHIYIFSFEEDRMFGSFLHSYRMQM